MARENLYVVEGDRKVPFLRGMLTHSLLERGLTFEEAYETAREVRARIRRRKTITKAELSKVVRSVVEKRFGKGYLHNFSTPPVAARPVILVTGQNQDFPFSKGILSQSLQASGLEPSSAYEVARHIEDQLQKKGTAKISSDKLRRVIYQTILENYDERFAERYLLWRYLKSPDRPLVILFGGATGTGKTTVAGEVAHRLGVGRTLATDTIRQIMRTMFSKDLLPAIHYSSYEAWKEREGLGEDRAEAAVEAFREQSGRVLVGVRAMVERAIHENFSLVIEGVHLVPGLMGLDGFADGAYILPLVISTLNKEAYLARFPVREKEAENRSSERYRKNFPYILEIQNYILEMAEHYEIPIVENVNLDQTVSSILSVITNTLREKVRLTGEDLRSRVL